MTPLQVQFDYSAQQKTYFFVTPCTVNNGCNYNSLNHEHPQNSVTTYFTGALLNTMDNLTLNSGQMCQPTDEDGPNLFDCQIKIFTKWYKSWSPSERSEFASQLNIIDPNLISSINSELQCQVRTH